MDDEKPVVFLAIWGVVCLVVGGWIAANYEPQRTGIILAILSGIGLILLMFNYFADEVLRLKDNDDEGPEITGMQLLGQGIGGLVAGAIPILLSAFTPLSIGLPIIALSVSGQFAISVFAAPPIEEFAFLMMAVACYKISYKLTSTKVGAVFITLVVIPVVFALYHWYAYGATFLVGGAFQGAAVFRFLTLLIVLIASAVSDSPGFTLGATAAVLLLVTLMHSDFNGYTYLHTLSIAQTPTPGG